MIRSQLRPRGALRHYAGLLAPSAAVAGRLALERDAGARLERVKATSVMARQRRDRTRPGMRGLVAAPGGRLRWQDVPAPPPPGPQAAVVRPIAVATCDLDRAMILGKVPFPLPLHLGHECVAEVVEVGHAVKSLEVGQRVVVLFQISCGQCAPCVRGHPGNCAAVPPLSMYGFGMAGGLWGGALADRLTVPYAEAMLVPLPENVDPVAAASVADNVSDAYRHIAPHLPRLLDDDPEAEVLLVAGLEQRSVFTPSVPLYAGIIALALGARRVSLVDSRPAVRRLAERLGLRALNPSDKRDWPIAPLTVDASATSAGLRQALRHTAADGVCTCVASLHRRVGFPMLQSYVHNVTFHVGRSHPRALIPEVLELMAHAKLRPEAVTTNVATFDEAPEALREHCHVDAVKTILVA